MEKSTLYTGTGDRGTTSLVGGTRIRKTDQRLTAYGTLDEFSAHLGVVIASPDCPAQARPQLLEIQNKLFNIGAYLATEVTPGDRPSVSGLTDRDVRNVENWIDALDGQTPKIHAFVLPGGTITSAFAHVARTVCRRCERLIIRLGEKEYVDPTVEAYINRLSDYLFILARYINFESGTEELIWRRQSME